MEELLSGETFLLESDLSFSFSLESLILRACIISVRLAQERLLLFASFLMFVAVHFSKDGEL